MTMLPMGAGGRLRGSALPPHFGQLLASLAEGEPGLPLMPAQPNGPSGAILMDAMRPPPLPSPVTRQQSAGPAVGGIAASPAQVDQPVQSMPGLTPAAPRPSRGRLIAGILADAFAGATGRPPMVAQMWEQQRAQADQRAYEDARWHRDRQAKREDDMRPRVEQVGDSLGTYDPASQTFEPIYTRPQPFETYARAQGFQPGTPEYAQAVEDYRLGGWSDPAVENRTGLEDVRSRSRNALEILRGANRQRDTETRMETSRENNIRSTGTSRDNSVRSNETRRTNAGQRDATTRRGQDLRSQLRGRRVGGVPVRYNEPMARDAQGRPLVVRNGRWVPAQ